jgi:hypothetical protein
VDVLDVDPRSFGNESLWKLEEKHGELPETVLSLTGGGGAHIFFNHVPGLKNLNGVVGGGLDLKTSGGYVILPPSHHISGRQYTWEGASLPGEVSFANPPQWFLETARGATASPASNGAAKSIGVTIPEGQRSKTLTSLAGSMRRRGLSCEAIAAALLEENRTKCSPPLSETEVRRIAGSVARYEPAAPLVGNGNTDGAEPRIRSIEEIPSVRECGAREIRYLIEPELPEGAVIALTGDSGSGKSTLATAWAGRVSAMARPVLILDRENPSAVLVDRLERLGIGDGSMLRIWGGWLSEEAPQPASALVLAWVASNEPRPLIVIDSLVAFHPGDENDAGETRAFMHQCRKLADIGATVVILHHTGKAETSQDFRGSSDFKAAIDAGFHVSNFSQDGHLDVLRLRCFKNRFGFSGEIVYRYAGGKMARDNDPHAPARTVTEQLTELLRTHPGIQAGEFEKLAHDRGLGRNRARTFLGEGTLSGLVHRETGAKNVRRYSLSVDHVQSSG